MASKAGDIHARAILLSELRADQGHQRRRRSSRAELAPPGHRYRRGVRRSGPLLVIAGSAYALFCIGEYAEAVAMLDRAIELAGGDPTFGAGVTIRSPTAFAYAFKGAIVGSMGQLDEARSLTAEGMRLARAAGDTETAGWVHSFECWLAWMRGEPDEAHAHAQQFLESAERIGDAFSRSWAWQWVGWTEGMLGRNQQAVEGINLSLAISRDKRSAVEGEAIRLVALADAHLGLGDPDRARRLVDEALKSVAAGRSQRHLELDAQLALARILLESPGADAADEIEAAGDEGA